MDQSPLLEVKNLSKHYQKNGRIINAVKNINFHVKTGEILGLVGESGSGKSTISKMIILLEKPTTGEILFKGNNILQMSRDQTRILRRQMQIVFQNPYSSLNPRMNLQQILNEPLDIHQLYIGNKRAERIKDLLHMVGLENHHLNRYPHQFSGGQRQRICIARALAVEPQFLICDEPLSALDLSVQAQIINLLRQCQKELGLAMLFISHDLAAVDMLADRIITTEIPIQN